VQRQKGPASVVGPSHFLAFYTPDRIGWCGLVESEPKGDPEPCNWHLPGGVRAEPSERGTEAGDSGTGRRILAPILGPFPGQKVP
jgi:hypothetical protein